MNSTKVLNYENRPIKFTERKMLLASLLRICNYFGNEYQYIGFGGLSFTDFKLFHKELHINKLFSIEGGALALNRLKFNSPYSFIKLINKMSTSALKQIDLTEKSLIWLDYDGTLDPYMFEDITLAFSKLPVGSVYIFTCNRELKANETNSEYTTEEFRSKFGSLAPYDIENKDFSSSNNYKTICKMINNLIFSTIKDRNVAEKTNLSFKQLYNITYQENRGAKMYTFGGLIIDDKTDLEKISLNDFEFIYIQDDTFKIEIPNFTRKEFDLLDSGIFNDNQTNYTDLGFNKNDINKYNKIYKYMPHFYDIRL